MSWRHLIFPIEKINWSKIIPVIEFIIMHLLRMAMFHTLQEHDIVTISLYTISNWPPNASWGIWPLRIVFNYLSHHFDHRKIPIPFRCRLGVRLLHRTFEVPFCRSALPSVYLYTVTNWWPLHLLAVCATFDAESSTSHHRSCSVKHLAAKNVMVNDLCKRPVVNMPIIQVPTWCRAPSLYLWCAVLLLRSCTLS